MPILASSYTPSESASILVLFLFGVIINAVVYKQGFFKLAPKDSDHRYFSLKQTFVCFSIYFINAFFLAPFLFHNIVSKYGPFFESLKTRLVLFQALVVLCNIALLSLYLLFQNKTQLKALWKDPSTKSTSYFYDGLIGVFTWFLSFPLIVGINALCDKILDYFFHFHEVDQVAVRFLKTSSSSWITLAITTLIIIVSAPFIEEFLFRGCIQNYLRRYLGTLGSIVTTSLIFACMHFSPSQNLSNVSLLVSLFFFSLYLGFVYEKTRSLITSIILHMTFNGISVIRILLS